MRGIEINTLHGYDKTLVCPPDKSISVRAVILNSYARGSAVVKNLSLCDDVMSAVECMRALGAEITLEGSTAHISGTGGKLKSGEVYCGNSATTARLLIGLLSGTDGEFTVTGDASLSFRPMQRVTVPLFSMGANVMSNCDGLPVRIIGKKLRGAKTAPGVPSAQVKSALLLAGLNADGPTSVEECERTRDHTEIMLKSMGANIETDGNRVTVFPSELIAADIEVPGDFSSALYPVCLALAVRGGKCTVKNVGLNPTRTAALRAVGERFISVDNYVDGAEPRGDITASGGPAEHIYIPDNAALSAYIDEYPALCALACFCSNGSNIRLSKELRHKETDRIDGILRMLESLGANARLVGDTLAFRGATELKYGTVDPRGDHRIAMAAAVTMAAGGGGYITDGACVSVSYPRFFEEVIGV